MDSELHFFGLDQKSSQDPAAEERWGLYRHLPTPSKRSYLGKCTEGQTKTLVAEGLLGHKALRFLFSVKFEN